MSCRPQADPFAVLLGTAFLCVVLACLHGICASLTGLATGLLVLCLSRPRWNELWPRIKAVNVFVVAMWLIVPWTTPGERIAATLPFSARGLHLCLLITLKANAILCVFTAFLAPLKIAQWGSALATLHCPAPLGWMFILMRRNIQILARQWHILQVAVALRAFSPNTSLRTYRIYAAMLARFFLAVHDRARILDNALKLRGGMGALPYTHEFSHPRADLLFIFCLLAVCSLLIALNLLMP